jgi:uncharacterized protein (DUF1684 family)
MITKLLTALICLLIAAGGCKQNVKQDINAIAKPVHIDTFMSKRMEAEIKEFRSARDDNFRTAPDSPLPPELKVIFNGLEYYPINWKYRFEGPVHRYPNRQKIKMITTSGTIRDGEKYGYIRFILDGKEFKLEVYRLLDLEQDNLLFVPFIDANQGKETYPAGRYIDLVEKKDGIYVIDFNNAYNPSCAYGNDYPCPVTPEENHLPIGIPAGEKILSIAAKIEKKA